MIDPRHPQYVPPSGPPDAKIVVLGEAPGAQELKEHKPFVGVSGDILFNRMLATVGIKRDECLITNVVEVKPPKNKLHLLPQIGVDVDQEMQDCRERLSRHPHEFIIAVGDLALQTLTGKKGITKWRSSLLQDYAGRPVFPLIHPAAFFKPGQVGWKYFFVEMHDMKKLGVYLKNPDFDTSPREIYILGKRIRASLKTRQEDPLPRTVDFYHDLIDSVANANPLCFDIETNNETITVVGLADSAHHAISIPFTQFATHDEASLILHLKEVLEKPTAKITHNGIYDATYLADKWGIGVRGMVWDTMLMHHCSYSELPHALSFLTSVYTHQPFYKHMAKEVDKAEYGETLWEYNALDCACTFECWEDLRQELEIGGTLDFYLSHYVPLSRTLANVQRVGIKLDVATRDELKKQKLLELARLQDELNVKAGQVLDVSSPKKLASFLYGLLKLPPQKNRKTGQVTTDKKALAKLRLMSDKPLHLELLSLIESIRDLSKDISTYLKPIEDSDARVRTSYNIAGNSRDKDAKGGTETGRLSSGENPYGRGTNLQNVPKGLRDMFMATEGFIMWQADMSAAESYVTCWESKDPRMLEILTNHELYKPGGPTKVMFHEGVGSIITGLPPTEVVGRLRDLAKRVGHAKNYRMGVDLLHETVTLAMPDLRFSMRDAQACSNSYDNAFARIPMWQDEVKLKVATTRKLTNCWGRRRTFLARIDEHLYGEACAFIPQSTIGDALNKCLIQLYDLFKSREGIKILGQTHDSILGECWPEFKDEVKSEVTRIFTQPLPLWHGPLQLRIPCEIKFGSNWKEVS